MDAFERAAQAEVEERKRRKRAAAREGFRIHLLVYVAVQVLLVATWWFTSDGGEVMPWFIFPMLGWGIGVAAHYLGTRTYTSRTETPRTG